MADALLTLDALRYDAGDRTLIRDVSLRIEAGRRTLILGPNGAGKSVLMRLMHGLIEPSAGRILWNGGSGRPAQAMVFQRPVMLRRSVLDNVVYALDLAGVPSAERRARALDVLERVGLTALADRPARVLSGGEQQRAALARAWALRPRVLFLDEPTASLDPGAAAEVERLIRVIADEGCSIVMVTHHLGQARRLADDIVFVDSGRITEHTPVADFFTAPRSAEAGNYLRGELAWA
ncbi:ATP-binding cassette domain-containing protein [Methyloversatilis sp.]|uniref:ATP-binding cassette domain-containing protein n=1 Tax=Methyloversatilis sp. TaxID=2569862 RepID=UPI002732554F|nr:ATP-binding cassette domain-containing protein [Methyloversatilis sp.]MDP2868191.1 ATP-binding cassette domain-containing protein [Methyloversatilis sp.]MDP3454779.1 ATP-binding cassette domain-containing protein [Methyloversatilis sp.]MDP3579054.1 ATP-binding cassette domain-containing protein [Methyloversatilis sp.]